MTTVSTDLAYPDDVRCHDCGREILIDSAMTYVLEEDSTISPLCEECAEARHRSAAARMTEAETVEK